MHLWPDKVFFPFRKLQQGTEGGLYCFDMHCNAILQMTLKMMPLRTVKTMSSMERSYYCSFQFHSRSMGTLFYFSNKTQPFKSPCEISVFTHKQRNTLCGCTEMLKRKNGMSRGPSLKRNGNGVGRNAVPYFLKFWNSASLQRRDDPWDMLGPHLHSSVHE